jgi:2-polyprenyl-3-methyl-5-hydroxy-6-metoxy-1,4-benzoquinol methylase
MESDIMMDAAISTLERIDPLVADSGTSFDRQTLALHLERYRFAEGFVKGRVVVDCACGTGYGSEMLAEGGAAIVFGVDISEEAVRFARIHHAHPNVRYCVADAISFEPPQTPDVWVTLETIEHLLEPSRYLQTIRQRLPVKGMLIASVPTTVSTDGNPFHRHDFSRTSWRSLLEQHGFVIAEELAQEQRFHLRQILGRDGATRQQLKRNLLSFYARNPRVAWARLALTFTRGFVNEYVVAAAQKK